MESHFLFDGRKTNPSPYDPIHAVQFDSLPMFDLTRLSSSACGVFDLTRLSSACGAHLETLIESSVVGQKYNKINYKIKLCRWIMLLQYIEYWLMVLYSM